MERLLSALHSWQHDTGKYSAAQVMQNTFKCVSIVFKMASWFDGQVVVVTSSSASECCSAACTGLMRTGPAPQCTAVPTSASAAAETKSFSPFRIPRVSPAAEVQLNIKNCVIGTILHPMLHTAVLQALNYLMMICFPFHLLHRMSQL